MIIFQYYVSNIVIKREALILRYSPSNIEFLFVPGGYLIYKGSMLKHPVRPL